MVEEDLEEDPKEEEDEEELEVDSDAESEAIKLPYVARVPAHRLGYQVPTPLWAEDL